MVSKINNINYSQTCSALKAEKVIIWKPGKGWTYSHHPHITFFNNEFCAMWSNAWVDEDAPGQRVMWSKSSDFYHWDAPTPLIDSQNGELSELVLTPAGFHQFDGRLVAYYGQYEYSVPVSYEDELSGGRKTHLRTALKAITCDRETPWVWSKPVDMNLPIVPNHGPQRTSSGRLIISGNISFPYTDDPTGLSGWKMTGIYPESMGAALKDDSEGFWAVKRKMNWPVGLCEGSFYETADHTLHMLLRSTGKNFSGKLWLTESVDDGTTWSSPSELNFSDNGSKFHFGHLPDGRVYYVGTPDVNPPKVRRPLVLSISEDSYSFTKHYVVSDDDYIQSRGGWFKYALFGYPHTLIVDGYLYIIISLRTEAIAVYRIQIADL